MSDLSAKFYIVPTLYCAIAFVSYLFEKCERSKLHFARFKESPTLSLSSTRDAHEDSAQYPQREDRRDTVYRGVCPKAKGEDATHPDE